MLTVRRSAHDGGSAAGVAMLLLSRTGEQPPGQLSLLSRYFRVLESASDHRKEGIGARGGGRGEVGVPAHLQEDKRTDYSRRTPTPCVEARIKTKLFPSCTSSSTTTSSRLQLRHQRCTGSPQQRPSQPGKLHAWPCAVVLRSECRRTQTFFLPERAAWNRVVKASLPPDNHSYQGAVAPPSVSVQNWKLSIHSIIVNTGFFLSLLRVKEVCWSQT